MMADYKYENYVDGVVVLAGRLQMQQAVYRAFVEGNQMEFVDDGTGFWRDLDNIETFNEARVQQGINNGKLTLPTGFTVPQYTEFLRNKNKLQGTLGQYDYVSIYTNNNVPVDKVLFATGRQDDAVGYYLPSEIAFVNANAALHDVDEGHHIINDKDATTITPVINWLDN